MPDLQQLWSELSAGRDDLVFLCVDLGDAPEVIRSYWEEAGFTLTAVRQDGDAVSRAFGVEAYPTNYIIGPDGSIAWRGVGWDEAAVRGALSDDDARLYPHADADALAYLKRLRARLAAAPALHVEFAGRMEGAGTVGTLHLQARMAKPAAGSVEGRFRVLAEDGEVAYEDAIRFVGDGTAVYGLDADGATVAESCAAWSGTSLMDGVLLLAAWAGAAPQPLIGLAFVAPDPEHADWTGVTFSTAARQQQTWWFDADGAWTALTVEDGTDQGGTTVSLQVRSFQLPATADPRDYATPLPEGYARRASDGSSANR